MPKYFICKIELIRPFLRLSNIFEGRGRKAIEVNRHITRDIERNYLLNSSLEISG